MKNIFHLMIVVVNALSSCDHIKTSGAQVTSPRQLLLKTLNISEYFAMLWLAATKELNLLDEFY